MLQSLMVSSRRDGVWLAGFDSEFGELTLEEVLVSQSGSTWLSGRGLHWFVGKGHPDFRGGQIGFVTAFNWNVDHAEVVNEMPIPGGRPAYIALHPHQPAVITAAYWGGAVSVYLYDETGQLEAPHQIIRHAGSGFQSPRQDNAHAHGIAIDPSGTWVAATDLGADSTFVYRWNSESREMTLHQKIAARPETGPRHAIFSGDGAFLYVLGELKADIMVYKVADGAFDLLQTVSAIPPDYRGPIGAADIRMNSKGDFVYANLRATRTMCRFRRDRSSGQLSDAVHTEIGGQSRCFQVDATGHWLLIAQTAERKIDVHPIQEDGTLGKVHQSVEVPGPMCLAWAD